MKANLKTWLKRGGLIAYPTESCFGLGCDPRNPRALKKLLKLKQRDASKGLILIAANTRQLTPFIASLNPALNAKMRYAWPAAHTWLVPVKSAPVKSVPAKQANLLSGGRDTLAVRVPAHAGARQLCQQAGTALVSTSANLSGQKSIQTYAACVRKFGCRVRVIQGKIGHQRKPSRIQNLISNQIIRE